jgi:hypothetical protein
MTALHYNRIGRQLEADQTLLHRLILHLNLTKTLLVNEKRSLLVGFL